MGTLSAYRKVHPSAKIIAGRSSSSKKQTTLRTPVTVADGFLRAQFMPLYEPVQVVPRKSGIEMDFFQSLSILCNDYQLTAPDTACKPYPYNILLSRSEVAKKLRQRYTEVSLQILLEPAGRTVLATKHTYDTGTLWYYIPVLPVYRLLHNRSTKKFGELLVAVFTYCYRVAGVPYFRDEDSYLYEQYEMIDQWLWDCAGDYEANDYISYREQIAGAVYTGDIMHRKIYNAGNLHFFAQRVESFIPANELEQEGFAVAREAYNLMMKYSGSSIYQHASEINAGEPDDEDYIIPIWKYISFIATDKGWLYDQLSETINSDFQECAGVQQPSVTRVFDGTAVNMNDNLDFENNFFPMLQNLCILLNKLS